MLAYKNISSASNVIKKKTFKHLFILLKLQYYNKKQNKKPKQKKKRWFFFLLRKMRLYFLFLLDSLEYVDVFLMLNKVPSMIYNGNNYITRL